MAKKRRQEAKPEAEAEKVEIEAEEDEVHPGGDGDGDADEENQADDNEVLSSEEEDGDDGGDDDGDDDDDAPSSGGRPAPPATTMTTTTTTTTTKIPFLPSAIKSSISSSDGRYHNRQRLLVLSSRGITARYRHLLEDLRTLIPHSKKESKLDAGVLCPPPPRPREAAGRTDDGANDLNECIIWEREPRRVLLFA